jgi:hypothetical protein
VIDERRWAEVIGRGVAYLGEQQQADGGFVTEVSERPDDFRGAVKQRTTFGPALVLGALNELEPAVAGEVARTLREVRQRAGEFVLAQRSEGWTFNYLPRGSAEAERRLYPDDWDDTVCALAALQQWRPEVVGPEVLALVVRQLTAYEQTVGGPYYTWLVPGEDEMAAVWRDVDLGVNSNIAYFLVRQGVVLPNLVALTEAAIEAGVYTTPYYAVSPLPVMFFVSRWYRGPLVTRLRAAVLERRGADGWWGNALESALGVLAVLGAGGEGALVQPAVERLMATQGDDGGWPVAAWYVEAAGASPLYAGSAAVTTALVLQALEAYRQRWAEGQAPQGAIKGPADEFYREVVRRMRVRLGRLEGDLREQAEVALTRQLERDRDRQIGLVPYVWERALGREKLVQLGMVSLYGWASYTIYDDFLDEEGQPVQLPAANVMLRELTRLLDEVTRGRPEMVMLVEEVLARIDAANTWEVAHCRMRREQEKLVLDEVPDYGDRGRLADRSLGHALGPLLLLLARGHERDSEVVRGAERFFRNYLIMRQLNDDMHDWEEDLARGQVNVVGAWLLRREEVMVQGMNQQELGEVIGRLKLRLWETEIERLCELIFGHGEAARAALRENPEIREVAELEAWLAPLEGATRRALRERDEARAFIAAYQKGRRP